MKTITEAGLRAALTDEAMHEIAGHKGPERWSDKKKRVRDAIANAVFPTGEPRESE